MKRLTRSRANAKIAGVCAGLAEYFEVDATFVRAAWVALSIVPGAVIGGIIAYLLVWMVMPEGLAENLTMSELVGLVAYLESLNTKK